MVPQPSKARQIGFLAPPVLKAVLSDGTAVNIVRRGDDIITSGSVHLLTLVGDDGRVFGIDSFVNLMDEEGAVEGVFSVENNQIRFNNAASFPSSMAGFVTAFDANLEKSRCPEVLRWLCDNYGLSFNPAGLYCYGGGGTLYSDVIRDAYCSASTHAFIFSAEEDVALSFPSDSTPSGVLACDGSSINAPYSTVPSISLSEITSQVSVAYGKAFNTWLFYLASGLPKEVFDNL